MNYVEAIVTLAENADLPGIQTWFEKHGFQTVRMKMGLLVTGGEYLFRQAFDVTEDESHAHADRDVEIPIPAALANSVTSITIRRLPSIHS